MAQILKKIIIKHNTLTVCITSNIEMGEIEYEVLKEGKKEYYASSYIGDFDRINFIHHFIYKSFNIYIDIELHRVFLQNNQLSAYE